MKGRLFRTTMLVIVLALVLAVPASAGKPPPLSVGGWATSGSGYTVSYVEANNITWVRNRDAKWVTFVFAECNSDETLCTEYPLDQHEILTWKGKPLAPITLKNANAGLQSGTCSEGIHGVLFVKLVGPDSGSVIAKVGWSDDGVSWLCKAPS